MELQVINGSIIHDLPHTKASFKRIAEQIVEPILNGNADALKAMEELKVLEEVVKNAKELIKDEAMTEADKYSKEDARINSVSFSKSESPTYDYSVNPEWVRLDKEKKAIEAKMKLLYKAGVTENNVDTETGEISIPAKIKSVSTSLKFNFEKGE